MCRMLCTLLVFFALATGMAILSALSLVSAFILDTVTHGRRSGALLQALSIERWSGDDC